MSHRRRLSWRRLRLSSCPHPSSWRLRPPRSRLRLSSRRRRLSWRLRRPRSRLHPLSWRRRHPNPNPNPNPSPSPTRSPWRAGVARPRSFQRPSHPARPGWCRPRPRRCLRPSSPPHYLLAPRSRPPACSRRPPDPSSQRPSSQRPSSQSHSSRSHNSRRRAVPRPSTRCNPRHGGLPPRLRRGPGPRRQSNSALPSPEIGSAAAAGNPTIPSASSAAGAVQACSRQGLSRHGASPGGSACSVARRSPSSTRPASGPRPWRPIRRRPAASAG